MQGAVDMYYLPSHKGSCIRDLADVQKSTFLTRFRIYQVMKRFWDMYPDEKAFATAKHKTRSPSQPLIAFHNGGAWGC